MCRAGNKRKEVFYQLVSHLYSPDFPLPYEKAWWEIKAGSVDSAESIHSVRQGDQRKPTPQPDCHSFGVVSAKDFAFQSKLA